MKYPKGGIEQARRNFMREQPELYAYIEARLVARTWKDAGDITSGACDQYGASNRCYKQAGRYQEKTKKLRTEPLL